MDGVCSRPSRAAWCGLTALSIVAALALPAGQAAARPRPRPKPKPKPHRSCPSGAKRKRVRGKWRCRVKPSNPKGTTLAATLKLQDRLVSGSKPRYRHVSRAEKRRLERLRSSVLAGAGRHAVQAALAFGLDQLAAAGSPKAGGGSPGQVDADGPTVKGWKTHVRGGDIPPDPGWEGSGYQETATATAEKPGKGKLKRVQTKKNSAAVRSCPDVHGIVPGKAAWVDATTLDATQDGVGRTVLTARFEASASDKARVGDDGKLRDFDQKLKFVALVQPQQYDATGRNVTPAPPQLYVLHVARRHLKPPIEFQLNGLDVHGVGPGADITTAKNELWLSASNRKRYKAAADVLVLAVSEFYDIARAIERQLEDAQASWQLGSCVQAHETAAQAQLDPGESTKISVEVSPPKGEKLAPGRLTAWIEPCYGCSEGSVSPAKASYRSEGRVTLTYTAPAKGWTGRASVDVAVGITSREGGDTARVRLKPREHSYLLRLSSEMSETFTPVRFEHGTGSATYSVSGSATIHAGAGSGALTWNAFSYSDEGVEEGCQDGLLMSADFTGTGTDPGTLNVRALDLSSADPKLTVEVVGPVEHVRGDFHPGASGCAAFTNDYDFHEWAYLLQRSAWDGPAGVGSDGEGDVSAQLYTFTGWQRSGSGWVKDMSYTPSLSAGESGTAHVRLELTPQ